MIPSSFGDEDSSPDVSGRASMDLMPRPAIYNPIHMCGTDYNSFAAPRGRGDGALRAPQRVDPDVIPSSPGGLDSSADVS